MILIHSPFKLCGAYRHQSNLIVIIFPVRQSVLTSISRQSKRYTFSMQKRTSLRFFIYQTGYENIQRLHSHSICVLLPFHSRKHVTSLKIEIYDSTIETYTHTHQTHKNHQMNCRRNKTIGPHSNA